MRTSVYLLATLKETPADAEIVSHQLMLRAGFIRKLSSGLYTWLPLGLRVLRNVETIIRQELNKIGALEILMPSIQPSELWEESGRWDKYGPLLLRITDRHDRAFCYGPTHEEVITDLARRELRSYKQLPINFYQIQTKFRDEIRPRFGVMRAREFIMKDAYSFHIDEKCLEKTYQKMHQAYRHIFTRLGLDFRPVLADSGDIGGNFSHEFQVLAKSGEDCIFYSDESDYAANIETAQALKPPMALSESNQPMSQVATPHQKTIAEVCEFLKVKPQQTVKTLIVHGTDSPLVALVLRGDHELNVLKAEKLPAIKSPLTLASDDEIVQALHCPPGFIGPIHLTFPVITDYSAAVLSDFVCGANVDGQHCQNVNWDRDLPKPETADLRNVVEGDLSPDGKGHLHMARGIEVGHIFQLGTKYSEALQAVVLDENGKQVPMQMGCYGIGVSRIVAAAIEQNHDANGIIWTDAMAPYQVALVPIQMAKSPSVKEASEKLYKELQDAGIDVLFDDRNERPGVMFSDMDLIGIPHRIVVGEKSLNQGMVEYKHRRDPASENIAIAELVEFIEAKLGR